ncbi:hypothetical protein RAAC3_TM7C00001G0276 [Candidatus Saccharibacteria bacterium RAAC3_TM7_1]|nr:hypothetical protein RAAC3_TM7C00001G0276 [Candidatus Saccharibacteria bacterium RAAC3_TM7_1]HCZ28322.1 hypothetical protein [Candidatus Saccharibacteria bacterium]
MKKITLSKSIIVWSLLISALVVVASLYGLLDPSIYSKETLNWATQAKGQDIGNLLAVPILLVCGYMYYKGSFKAALLWLGTLLYLIYAYVVYAMAVHFNMLFLVYVAILGLSSYAVLLTIKDIRSREGVYPKASAKKFAAYTIMSIGVLFGLLWLSEIIPALIAGNVPKGVVEAGLWVNPIHVIDLSVVLPGFIITGYYALKNKPNGPFFLAPWLTFSVLMGLSIVAAMILMTVDGVNAIPPMVMVAAVVVMSSIALTIYIRRIT